MSKNTKIILTIAGGILLLCVLACVVILLLMPAFAKNMVSTSPAQAQQVGQQIADYTVPPGYRETGMDLFFEKLVMISPTNQSGPDIMLLQVNTTSRAQAEQQMRQALEQQFARQSSGTFHQVEDHAVTLKGESSTLSVSENDATGRLTMRQAFGTFKGKGGTAVVMFMGGVSDWDWKLVDDFCASIR